MTSKTITVALTLCLLSSAVAQGQCPSLPFCRFSFSIGQDGYSVQFNGETSCEDNLNLTWYFGDGAKHSSSGSNLNLAPVHIYPGDGKYVVRMVVSLPAPHTTCTHTAEGVIEITGGTPSSLWLTLDGPTLAAECQQVIFSANAVGGLPPYRYQWSMGDDYCPSETCPSGCTASPNFEGQATQIAKYNPGFGASTNNVCVTVTDALGAYASECLLLRVKPMLFPLEIVVRGTMCSNSSMFPVNSDIIFLPDINPLSAFEYPTNYHWDFGDGTTYLDNVDGSGFAMHRYALESGGSYPKAYTVKLTVSDPYGSMQAIRTVWVCGPSGTNEDWVLSNGTSGPTKVIGKPGSGYPTTADISFENLSGQSCWGVNVRWLWEFLDVNLNNLPEVVLKTTPGANPVLFTHCNDPLQYILPHEYGSSIGIATIPYSCYYNSQEGDTKYWGCLAVKASAYETNPNISPPDNTTNVCKTKQNPCLVYIQPDDMEVGVELSGDCRDYTLSAQVQGGGWKKTIVNGQPKRVYKEYVWKAYETDHPMVEVDILLPVPGEPDKVGINLDHPYFEQFGPDNYAEFHVRLTVNDFANNSVEAYEFIMFNPFRLHIAPEQTRCPGVESPFSIEPLATGGSDLYTFTWSDPTLTGDNPVFVAPQQGSVTYHVTVSDGASCSLSRSVTVTAAPLQINLTEAWLTCDGGSNQFLAAPTFGGSGHYGFTWSASDPAHLAHLSDPNMLDPVIQGFGVGQSITYTLTVADLLGGCTATHDLQVTTMANDLAVSLTAPASVCARAEAQLVATGTPVVYGWGAGLMQYHWSTNNRKHDLTGLPLNTKVVPVTEVVSSYPGTYNYKVRYQSFLTGCYAEAAQDVTILPQWAHTGFVPEVRSAVAGESKALWSGNNNYFTSGPGGSKSITWAPGTPVVLEWHNGVPKKGTFVPTPEVPYLTMTVVDNASGCSQTFKSIRYIISEASPELSILADRIAACTGDEICFDVTFDMQLLNYTTTLLPPSILAQYRFRDPHPNAPGVMSAFQILTLNLQNPSGLYRARLCEQAFFQNPPSFGEYRIDVKVTATDNPILRAPGLVFPDLLQPKYIKEIDLYFQNEQSFPSNHFVGCLPYNANHRGLTLSFGNLPCTSTVDHSNPHVEARDHITILPDGGVEFITSFSPILSKKGRMFRINPCITPIPALQEPDPEQAPLHAEDRNAETHGVTAVPDASLLLETYPNPFTHNLNIRYAFQADEPATVTLHLLDYSGRLLQTVHHRPDCPPGEHILEFNGGHLAPGMYLLQITVEDKSRLTRKITKVSY